MAEYTVEVERKVYNDGTGDYVSVGMDADSLGLVDIRQVELDKTRATITLEPEHAKLVAEQILAYLKEFPPERKEAR